MTRINYVNDLRMEVKLSAKFSRNRKQKMALEKDIKNIYISQKRY